MRISELILKLEEIKNQHGDLLCTSQEDGFGGKAVYLLSNNISIDSMYYDQFLYDENIDPSDVDVLKKIFPDFTGDYNNFDDVEKYANSLEEHEIKIITFKNGFMIYST